MLRPEAAGAWHVIERDLDTGPQNVVTQVMQSGIRILFRLVENHLARLVEHVALDHNHLFLVADVLNFHGQQQFADHRTGGLEIVHQVGN